MAAPLIVSLSGLSDRAPQSLVDGATLAAHLDDRDVPLSLLVRPCGPDGVAWAGSGVAGWIRERLSADDAVVLHGYNHAADPTLYWHSTADAMVWRRAEFATLPRHEAGLRLLAARRAMTAVGLRSDVFVPPRWLASPGTVEALREQGFAVLADEGGVRSLRGPGPDLRARVLHFRICGGRGAGAAQDTASEAWCRRVFRAEVVRAVRRGGPVRIHVRAEDLGRADRRVAVLAAVDAALACGAVPTTYRLRSLAARA